MEEKYYIPDISEFKVGFEFEYKDPQYDGREEFQRARVEDDCTIFFIDNEDPLENYSEYEHLLSNILFDIGRDNIRVKYLDSKDIISLDFNFSHDVYVKNCGDRLLSLVIKDDKIRICEMSNSDKYKVLFYGKIKNKSELKDILEKI